MVFLQLIAFIQIVSETIYRYIHHFCGTSKDLILLHNGQWLISTIRVPQVEIHCIYNADKHAIISVDEPNAKTIRWPWLSVVTRDDLDISEFFSSLRVPAEHTLTAANVLMLYAHQKGVLYTRDLEVTGRDGSIISL